MRESRNAATVLLVSVVLFVCAEPPCFANGVLYRKSWSAIAPWLSIVILIGFSLTLLIEFIVVCLVLWCPPRLWWRVFAVVGLVNLVTFPPTQVAWWYFNYEVGPALKGSDGVVAIMLLEVLVALAEFFLLRWQFQKLWRLGVFEKPVSNGRIVCAAVAANAASFAFGFAALLFTTSLVSRIWARSAFLF